MINLATPNAARVVVSSGLAEQLWQDSGTQAHQRWVDESGPMRSEMPSAQIAELFDWTAVTDVVDGGRERTLERPCASC